MQNLAANFCNLKTAVRTPPGERIYQGWNSSSGTPTGPTEVIREDATDGYDETLTMSATPHLSNGAPDGTEAISDLQSLTRDYMNDAGQVIAEDDYFNLSGLAYSCPY